MSPVQKDSLAIELVITEPTEYVDRSLATASWWDRYTLLPGTYRVVWEISSPAHVQYGRVLVDAILEETYRVNRVFTASSSETTEPKSKAIVPLGGYPWTWLKAAAVTSPTSPEGRMHGGRVRYAVPAS